MTTDKKTAVIEFALNPNNASKSRTKAMQLAATVAHVESIRLKGDNLDQLVVKGKEIDAVAITVLLQKKLGAAKLIDYAPTKDRKPIKETFRRLSCRPDSQKDLRARPNALNNRNGYPDHHSSRNGYHDHPYGNLNGYPGPFNYGSYYPDQRHYDQRRTNPEPYPINQIEYVSYHDS